jgi:hypothetical protein
LSGGGGESEAENGTRWVEGTKRFWVMCDKTGV